mmetsp:Transcript_76564/g.216508  ORF Transcript_76564/g.216508 Transcript_76564/m.216508 type:complete len:327 (+) Transcript_76564:70-1050(+)
MRLIHGRGRRRCGSARSRADAAVSLGGRRRGVRRPHGLEQPREVKLGGRHLLARDLEPRLPEGIYHCLLGVQVGARCLRRPGEQPAEGLEEGEVPRVGGEGDDEPLRRQRGEVAHHLGHLVGRVVDEHVDAQDRVVRPLEGLQVGRDEARALREVRCGGALRGLGHHRLADVRGDDRGAPLGERQAKRAHAAAGVAEGLAGRGAAVRVDPAEHLVHGDGVPLADVHLHHVHLAVLAVDAAPPREALVVEVLDDLGLVVDGHAAELRSQRGNAPAAPAVLPGRGPGCRREGHRGELLADPERDHGEARAGQSSGQQARAEGAAQWPR